ncbi:MAG: ABC transporter ATP-binding protein [Terriglobales bacterium]
MIEIQSVTKIFGRREWARPWRCPSETRALDGVSLKFETGRIGVLLGPNGSGKTTLLKLLSTILLPDSGLVRVGGHDTAKNEDAVRRVVGFAVGAERSFFPRLTARENLRFFAVFEELPPATIPRRIEEVLAAVNLTSDADKQAMKFSSGMLHRLGIARAILKSPAVLLLDEPSRSLDPAASEELWKMLLSMKETGTTVLVASHNFEETASIADAIAVLDHGRLAGCKNFSPRGDATAVREFYFSVSQARSEAKRLAEAPA